MGAVIAGGLLLARVAVSYAADQANPQEPQFISTEVVVDPYDQPPPRGDTSVSDDISTGPSTMDPNGVSPNRQLLPVNES
jgi:hypothetical protein